MHNQYNHNEKTGMTPAIACQGSGSRTVSAGGVFYPCRVVFADNLCAFGGS